MIRGLHRLATPAFLGLCAATVTLGWGQPAPADAAASAPRAFLDRLCDDFGGRMTGTPGNVAALDRLAEELRTMGYNPAYSRFTMPGWTRGDDQVELVEPFARPLRVAALSYAQAHPAFTAPVVSIGNGRPQDYPAADVTGRVGLLDSGTPQQISELVTAAQARGLKGILFINREGGGQLLARTGGFSGAPLPLPVYSINQEEGRWLHRLLVREVPVRVRMETRSQCAETATANLVVRIPGSSTSRIIVGAHFDSWDLGQGAMDNGIGIAQLYALAQALRGAKLFHTIELVWFNGEEQGLWGSRHEASRLGAAPIVAMINLDMVGVPVAVNALGDESLVPFLERWHEGRATDRRLALGVQNINWVGSDHTPYQLAGVRAITFNAPIPRESVRYYHDLADTIDKVPPTLIDDSAAIITDLVRTLAADQSLEAFRRSPKETETLFTRFNLERRLRAMGLWTFDR